MMSGIQGFAGNHPQLFNTLGAAGAGALGGKQGANAFLNFWQPKEMLQQSQDLISSQPQQSVVPPDMFNKLQPPPEVGAAPLDISNQRMLQALFKGWGF